MKILVSLTLAFSLLVSACTDSHENEVDAQTNVAASPASSEHNYQCESGEIIAATYPSSDTATVEYQGNSYNMHIAVSASGARYLGGGLEWWTKGAGAGSSGMLLDHMADGTTGDSIELCTEL